MSILFGVRLLGVDANLSLLAYLSGRYSHLAKAWASDPSCSPAAVENPYFSLGTRPDAVEWLWNHIHSSIPSSRPWVVYGTPALVNPVSEIVFAFAAGTNYCLRLPAETREVAIAKGAKQLMGSTAPVDLSAIGEDWVVGLWRRDDEKWWQSAFEYSGRAG